MPKILPLRYTSISYPETGPKKQESFIIQQSKGRGSRAIIGVFSWQSKMLHNLVEGRYGSSLGRTLCFLQPLLEQRKMHTTIIMTAIANGLY